MKEFVILQLKLYKEGKSSIPFKSLDLLAKKFLSEKEYKSILESKQKYNFNKTSMKESVDFYNKIAENYLTKDEIVEIFGE